MEFTGSVAGGVAGMLNIKGDGDEVTITPVLTSGVKVATIILNEGKPDEESFDLYAPEGVSSYADLSDKPSINGHTLSGNQSSSDLELFSGSYNDLSNKPTLNGNTIAGNMFTLLMDGEEHVVGKFFDELLYFKTVRFTKTGTSTYYDLSSLNIKDFIYAFGVESANDGSNRIVLNYHETSNWYCFLQYYPHDNKPCLCVFCSQSDYESQPNIIANVLYTKNS